MNSLVAVLRDLMSQEVARTNAGLAAIRIQNSLRQYDEVDAFLQRLARDPTRTAEDDDEHAYG